MKSNQKINFNSINFLIQINSTRVEFDAVQINSTDPDLIQRLRKLEWEINVKVFSDVLGDCVIVSGSEEHIFEIIMGLANETVYERVDTD